MDYSNYIKGNRNVNGRKNLDVVQFTLHNVEILNSDELEAVESAIKTYNSMSRCAFKRFQKIGLREMMKGVKPIERKWKPTFSDYHEGYKLEAPLGMSEELWRKMRFDVYARKKRYGLSHANRFWQIDKDLGCPIRSTEKSVRDWAKEKEYATDSIIAHEATMNGYASYVAFEKKRARWQTKKNSAVFGDMVGRSKKRIDEEAFDLTRNSSIRISGKVGGNPKFKFNLEEQKIDFILNRKRIGFSFKRSRFSKKGYATLSDIISHMDKMPVTVTITRLDKKGRFNVTLSYAPKELSSLKHENNKSKDNIIGAIYYTDEKVCHRIVNVKNGKVLHSKTYDINSISGYNDNKHSIETLKWNGKFKEAESLERKLENKKDGAAIKVITQIMKISKAYGTSTIVVESARGKSYRNFSNSIIVGTKHKVMDGCAEKCFIQAGRFVKLVKNGCAKNNIKFSKVNGEFIQAKAILDAKDMDEALGNACSSLIEIQTSDKESLGLTHWIKRMVNPSMLDWIGHLLHNHRNRQARLELRRALQDKVVERAICLLDNRHSCSSKDKGR